MSQINRNPFSEFDISDWKWEFLRRNQRYRQAYKAVEWLKRRARRENTSPFFKGFGLLEPVHFLNLTNRLQGQLSLSHPRLKKEARQNGEWVGSLPSPEIPAYEFEYSPVRVQPIVALYDHKDFNYNNSGHPDDEVPGQLTAKQHEVIAVIDIRFNLEQIADDLKKELAARLSNERQQIAKYSDYLSVWDLWEQGKTADEIAPALWAEKNETQGGRDTGTGDKGSLLQKVYDQKDAAKKLIEKTFPDRDRSKPKNKI